MHTAIIEFNTLTNAVWSGSQYNDFLFVAYFTFIGAVIFKTAVEIGCFGFKFCRTGVHHFVNPFYPCGLSFFVEGILIAILHDFTNLCIAEAVVFCFFDEIEWQGIKPVSGYFLLYVNNLLDFIDEPAVDSCCLADGFYTYSQHQGIFDPENPVPLGYFKVFNQFFCMHHAFAIIPKTNSVIFQTLAGFLNGFGEASPDRHNLSYRFHLQAKGIVGALEFIEIPAGYFNDHIIQCRFKIC